MRFYRWIIVIAIAAVVILAIGYGLLPKPVPVDAIKTSRGSLRVTIDEEGKTRVKDRYVISAPVAGFMRRIELEVGDRVKRGQTMVELEPLRSDVLDPRSRAEAEASVSAAQAALDAALENARAVAAEAEYARQKLERLKKLFDEALVSKDQLEQAESDAKRAEANLLSTKASVNASRSELEKARAALRYSAAENAVNHKRLVAISSPVDGRVLKIHHESEGVMNKGEPLVDIGDPVKLEVKVEVLSADAVNIKPGTPVLFERWGGDKPLSGKVRIVEPTAFTKISSLGVEEQRVLVIADIISLPESWQKLGDGYRVEASFIIWEGKDVLQIPASALFRKGDRWAVFVVEDNRAHQRQVEVGHHNGVTAEIVFGLSEGELVITHPDDSIKEGTRVRMK